MIFNLLSAEMFYEYACEWIMQEDIRPATNSIGRRKLPSLKAVILVKIVQWLPKIIHYEEISASVSFDCWAAYIRPTFVTILNDGIHRAADAHE